MAQDVKLLRVATSWDDGHIDDMRIAELLLKYRLPGIFFIPDFGMLDVQEVEQLDRMGFEIGGHTCSHPEDLKMLSNEDLSYEIGANKQHLERAIGHSITKFCYPGGRYDERVIDRVREAGYTYARTTWVLKDRPRDRFRVDTTIHVYPRREYEGREWQHIAKDYARQIADTDGVFHLWGHAVDINNFNYWNQLEEFFIWLTSNYAIIRE